MTDKSNVTPWILTLYNQGPPVTLYQSMPPVCLGRMLVMVLYVTMSIVWGLAIRWDLLYTLAGYGDMYRGMHALHYLSVRCCNPDSMYMYCASS